jgi:AcrR family transcriptional regulator
MSKKDDIINTALNLFNSHSYNSIGVDRIISESGVAKMTFYKYFPSKAKLIEECLIRRNINLQESLGAAIAACDPQDYMGHIRTAFFWYHAWFHASDFNGCMFQKAVEEISKIYPSSLQPAIDYKEWLSGRLRDALQGLGVQQADQLAALLSSILDGMTIQAQIDPNAVHIDDYWNRVEKLIQLEIPAA